MASLFRSSALALAAALLAPGDASASPPLFTSKAPLSEPFVVEVPCSRQYELRVPGASGRRAGCTPGAPPVRGAPKRGASGAAADAAAADASSSSASSGPNATSSLLPLSSCGRYIEDGFLSRDESQSLLSILDRAFARAGAADAGPSIADLNSGFVRRPWRDGEGEEEGEGEGEGDDGRGDGIGGSLSNMYEPAADPATGAVLPPVAFTAEELASYGAVMERIRLRVSERVFGLSAPLFFTAPTFVTRTAGKEGWAPRSVHDEYWHPHADKVNSAHYDYSGLVYLSEHGVDFTGGEFAFLSPSAANAADGTAVPDTAVYRMLSGEGENGAPAPLSAWHEEHVVEPSPGRLLIFTAGVENVHRVKKVESGVRYVLSMWFSCDPRREFKNFLDGRAHNRFEGGGREEL